MAFQTIDLTLDTLFVPAGMAAQTTFILHGIAGDTEIVDGKTSLAVAPVRFILRRHPCPVNGFVKLGGGFRVTGNAGIGDLFPGGEIFV